MPASGREHLFLALCYEVTTCQGTHSQAASATSSAVCQMMHGERDKVGLFAFRRKRETLFNLLFMSLVIHY